MSVKWLSSCPYQRLICEAKMGLHLWPTVLFSSSVSFFSLTHQEAFGGFFRYVLWSLAYCEVLSSSPFSFCLEFP